MSGWGGKTDPENLHGLEVRVGERLGALALRAYDELLRCPHSHTTLR